MLKLEGLRVRIGGRVLIEGANVVVDPGEKVGVVGRNGAGKTTLFRVIAGAHDAEAGTVGVPPHWRIGITTQDVPGGEASLIETVLAADAELTALWREAETAADPGRIADIHEALTRRGAHTARSRAARILAGLGFDEAAQQRPCASFSGGWRMRVALASLLFTAPDLLLLDEPTNHLDLEAALWLHDFIARYDGTALVISHDRDLLNRSVTAILHLEGTKLTKYRGTFDQFEETRRLRLELTAKQRAKQQARRAHMQSFVERFRFKATKARQVQSRVKMLAKMEPLAEVAAEQVPGLRFPEATPPPPPLYSLTGVAVGYGGAPILRGLSLRLDGGDRIGLLGANGNGKSTFLKLLAGDLTPMAGTVVRSPKAKAAFYSQHLAERLDLSSTAAEALRTLRPDDEPVAIRTYLGGFGLSRELAQSTIGRLSGGERARLLFALMAAGRPHVLLLDEPTNHLDMGSREVLTGAINDFGGAVVIVSHDPHLLSLTADRLWLVAGGTVAPFDGDMADYRRKVRREQSPGPAAPIPAPEGSAQRDTPRQDVRRQDARRQATGPKGKQRRRQAADERQALAAFTNRVRAAEAEVDRMAVEKQRLTERLADPALYRDHASEVQELQRTAKAVERDLRAAEEALLAAQEELSKASARP